MNDTLTNARAVFAKLFEKEMGRPPNAQDVLDFDEMVQRSIADRALKMTDAPDYDEIINPTPDDDGDPFLIEGLVRKGENIGLIIPTNTGGSTLLINFAASAIQGKPLLAMYDWSVKPEDVVVVWVNPEEAHVTPHERLRKVGLSERQIREQVIHLYTREKRFYFNNALHVEAMIETLKDADLIPGPEKEVLLIVDGFDGTLTGEAWNADFEAWKNGLGEFKRAIGARTAFVRSQTTTQAARNAANGKRPKLEDVRGGQFATWPDLRITYSKDRDDPEQRKMELRGRRIGETTITVGYRERENRVFVVEMPKRLMAQIRVATLGRDEAFRNAVRAGTIEDPTSPTQVAEWLWERHDKFRDEGVIEVTADQYRKLLRSDDLADLVEGMNE